MVGATSTTATNTATMVNINRSEEQSSRSLEISKIHKCSMCNIGFVDSIQQRLHVKSEWQYAPSLDSLLMAGLLMNIGSIYNLHKKVDGQSSVGEEEYIKTLQRKDGGSETKRAEDGLFVRRSVIRKSKYLPSLGSEEDERNLTSEEPSTEEDDEIDNDDAQSSEESSSSEDVEVANEHEGIGWKDNEEGKLASGKVVSNRTSRRIKRTHAHQQPLPLTTNLPRQETSSLSSSRSSSPPLTLAYLASTSSSFPTPVPSKHLSISKRDSMGITGLNDIEKKALLVKERKMAKVEERDRKGFAESVDWKGNCQKHYRIGGSRGGKKMGGLEKRLG